MAITAHFLRNIMAEARPIIERQMNDAKLIAALRTVVANNGGDWGALKALIKAHVEDENDDTGEGKRVQKIRDKADSTSAYADMLGLANMNENNFSADQSYAEVKGRDEDYRDEVSPEQMDELRQLAEPILNAEEWETVSGPAWEITEQEQPGEPATQSGLINEVRSGSTAPDAGTFVQCGSAPAESASDAISAEITPSTAPAVEPEAVTPSPPPVSGAHSKRINPDCRKAARGEQCALMHSQALCSKCRQAVFDRKAAA